MKKVEWATMNEAGQTDALNEMLIRLDELNENAGDLDPVVAARRAYRLLDDFVDALYPDRDNLETYAGPSTTTIYEKLHDSLRTDAEADADTSTVAAFPHAEATR